MRQLPIILIVILMTITASAQNINDILNNANDNFAKNEMNEKEDEIPDELIELSEKPIDINSEDVFLLVQLNLLSQKQADALSHHIIKFGKLIALEELQLIDEFDKETITTILPYIVVTGSTAADKESQTVTLRFQQKDNGENAADFQGDPSKLLVKYRGNFKGNLSCGLTAEKDPGEQLSVNSSKAGFDFYSFFLQLRPKKIFTKIIVGDFNVSFGQGISAWTGSGFTSTENIISICKSGRGISQSASTEENKYLRGIALEKKFGRIVLTTWFSSHKIDGNLDIDPLTGKQFIKSLLTSGYHRSQKEISTHNICRETYLGTNIKTELLKFKTGLTFSYQHFSTPLNGSKEPYNQFDFRGSSNINFGVDYSRTIRNVLLFGESTVCSSGSLAFINGLLVSAGKKLSLAMVHHNYDKKFHSLRSNAFGSNTDPSNERGFYAGINMKINREYSLSVFLNNDNYPNIKYRIDLPSFKNSTGLILNYAPGKKLAISFRLRQKFMQQNDTEESAVLKKLKKVAFNNLRITTNLIIDESWEYRTKIESGWKKENDHNYSSAHIISQDLFFHPPKKKISMNLRYAVYRCPDFDLRFYEYENDLPGAFSIPFYYGNGSKFYLNINYKFRNVTLSTKLSRSWNEGDNDFITRSKLTDEIKFQAKISL